MSFKTMLCAAVMAGVISSAASVQARPKTTSDNGSYPKIDVRSPECDQIFKAARILFAGNSPRLVDSSTVIQRANLGLVLAPVGLDEEAPPGQKFWIDRAFIDGQGPGNQAADLEPSAEGQSTTLAPDPQDYPKDGVRAVFWQKTPIAGARFVVGQKPMNWEGDWFDLFVVEDKMPVTSLHDYVAEALKQPQTELKYENGVYIIYRNLWHRPWLFYNAATKHMIAVNTQASWSTQPERVLSDWAIYMPDGNGKTKCVGTINFCPRGNGFALLPKGPLRDLALLLDKIIGIPSQEEGSMRPTPRLRNAAALCWCNLMLRPWAIEKPGNSAIEIETGLKKWAKGSPVYKQQYAQLKVLYPKALDALTVYYQSHFHKSPNEARKLATKSLDLAYRNNFSF